VQHVSAGILRDPDEQAPVGAVGRGQCDEFGVGLHHESMSLPSAEAGAQRGHVGAIGCVGEDGSDSAGTVLGDVSHHVQRRDGHGRRKNIRLGVCLREGAQVKDLTHAQGHQCVVNGGVGGRELAGTEDRPWAKLSRGKSADVAEVGQVRKHARPG